MKSRAPRPPIVAGTGSWLVRWWGPGSAKGESDMPSREAARVEYFRVKALPEVMSVELRGPDGKLWFKDHFFANDGEPQ